MDQRFVEFSKLAGITKRVILAPYFGTEPLLAKHRTLISDTGMSTLWLIGDEADIGVYALPAAAILTEPVLNPVVSRLVKDLRTRPTKTLAPESLWIWPPNQLLYERNLPTIAGIRLQGSQPAKPALFRWAVMILPQLAQALVKLEDAVSNGALKIVKMVVGYRIAIRRQISPYPIAG